MNKLNKRNFLATASAFALCVGLGIGAAQAADPVAPFSAPSAPGIPYSSWEGWYAGLQGGWGYADPSLDRFNSGATTALDNVGSNDGFVFGVHGGYNWLLGVNNLVAGVEVDADFANINGWIVGSTTSSAFYGDVDLLASVRLRLGMVVGENTLINVNAGLAYTDSQQIIHAGSATSPYAVEHDWGAVIGLGVESMVSEKISIRGDVSYYFFGDQWYTAISTGGVGDMNLNVFTVRVGMSFHLN